MREKERRVAIEHKQAAKAVINQGSGFRVQGSGFRV
jgi:hypothetical protein